MVPMVLRLFSVEPLPRRMLLVALYAAMLGWGNIEAATLIVTTTADSGVGSLRATIAAASDGDSIQFDPALNGQTISLTGGELGIDRNITIRGPGATVLAVSRAPQAAFLFRIFYIMPGHTVVIEGLTINGGQGDGGAGGIANGGALTINNCIVRNNMAFRGDGGGIINEGTLAISNSSVKDNLATSHPITGGGSGGGIINGGTLTITNSTISGNATAHGSPMVGIGGGIWNAGGTVEITNSTISGNHADVYGGGIACGGGSLTMTNSTISGNFVEADGGGIANSGPLTITNSTLSGNQANGVGAGINNSGSNAALEIGNTILSDSGVDLVNLNGGMVTSLGYNLGHDNGGGFLIAAGDQINTNPVLGPLQNNGGPTFTHEPMTGSPAINSGDPNFTPPPFTDQRGYARMFNGRIDIGSCEVQPIPTATPTATATATATATVAPTVTPTPTPPAITISGRISYCSNPSPGPVLGVMLVLTGSASGSTLSDSSGNYNFSVPSGGSYTVTPTKAVLGPGFAGIDTVDVVATQRHFLIIGTLLTGCRLSAADVNGDAMVNTVDAMAIQRFFLILTTGNVGKYEFTPSSRTYLGVVTNQAAQDYDTLVFGDVAARFVE